MIKAMGKVIIHIIMITMLLSNGFGYAQDSARGPGPYLEMAARNNPQIQAAYSQYLAALEKVPQVGSLPDPQASFGYFIKPMELLGGNQVANIELMQMFPWFGTLKASRDEASLMAKAKFETFNNIKTELFFLVRADWYQLMKYDQEIALIKTNIELLESLEKVALEKFKAPDGDALSPTMPGNGTSNNTAMPADGGMNGMNAQQNPVPQSAKTASTGMSPGMGGQESGLADVLRVKMEILEQKNNLASVSDQRRTEEAAFNALLNRDLSTPVQISDSLVELQLPINRLAMAETILKSNPMLAMLENENESYAFMEQRSKKMGLPMLGIGLNYMLIQKRSGNMSMMNGKDMLMPMVAVTIPVYRKKYNAMQKEARLRQEAGTQQTIDMKNSLLVQYRKVEQDLDDAGRRVALYKEQADLAGKTTALLLAGFSTTGNNYEEVLRMQMKALDYGFKYIEAIVDYNTAVAMAEKLMNSVNY